jgi:hypothetical protein
MAAADPPTSTSRDARPRRLPARGADRRVAHRAGAAVRRDARDDPDLGHAHRGRIVRLRARPAGVARPPRSRPVGVRLHATGHPVPAAEDAGAQDGSISARRRRARRWRSCSARAGAPSCCSRATRAAHVQAALVRAALPYPLFVQGSAPRSGAAPGVPRHAARGAAGHLVVLAGRGRGGRATELRDHRQAAVRVAGRPRSPPRGSRPWRPSGGEPFNEYQVPLADPHAAAGPGPADSPPDDRGVLAVLDPRLRTMGYGRRFLDSFPPAPVVHDLAAIARFLDE